MSEGRWVGDMWETTCVRCGAVLQMRAPEVEPRCLFCPDEAAAEREAFLGSLAEVGSAIERAVDRGYELGLGHGRDRVVAWLQRNRGATVDDLCARLMRGEDLRETEPAPAGGQEAA